ncbi:hypothetical protein [Actinomadura fibrosa]|uniref:Uncharacterized protein n=1 Tax=Actinomadura fibrosa TaxID=111802 RepID=A0ABW2XVY0_9ACTN|nr:hypothetical protein [Actinomadura fibrosa]
MRRIAAVGLAAGTLLAGMAVAGAPAEAATGKWAPYNSYANLSSSGTYSRGSSTVTVSGKLSDAKKNGWTACVRFLFTNSAGSKYYARFKIEALSQNGTWYNYDGKATVSIKGTSPKGYRTHMWVQECGRNKKTGKYAYGKGKKIF